MFSQPIVFVVGAGASAEFDLPLGFQLKSSIKKALNFVRGAVGSGDRSMFDMLGNRFRQDAAKYHEAATELAARMDEFESIDEALHWFTARAEIVLLGKAEIVRQILLAENRSKLFNAETPTLIRANQYEETWLPYFLSMVLGSQTREQAAATPFQNITIINFNYDRTIEHFLFSRLQTNFGLRDSEAKNATSSLTVIRPYGSVGPLPWQNGTAVQFGNVITTDHDKLLTLAVNVRTFTEQHLSSDLQPLVRSAIEAARFVVFLGFGFHQQNMALLQCTRGESWRRVLATVLGIDQQNWEL
jgi:hypothetical protein